MNPHLPPLLNAILFAAVVVALALGYVAHLFHTAPLTDTKETDVRDLPVTEAAAVVGGRNLVAGVERYLREARCAEDVCLCCVCTLRGSEEFGDAFTAEDDCCRRCHEEMADPQWPGRRCGSLPSWHESEATP